MGMIGNQAYNIVTENELAAVLSHYSTEFVMSVLEDAKRKKYNEFPLVPLPNVAAAWEANFKVIMEQYSDLPDSRAEIMRVRTMTYQEIIKTICEEFYLKFTDDDNVDLYTAAYNLYDFFVCNFSNHMVDTFSNYIYREKNNLYDAMGLADLKKNKDSGTIYGKKVFKDIKLAVIIANIDKVINYISVMDIDLDSIFALAPDSVYSNYMSSIVSTEANFFKDFYVSIINSFLRADYLTAIRLQLQQYALNDGESEV